MFIHTDILRAALCCVADETEERKYLQGVHITPTHIEATDGRAAVAMEHGADTELDAVFIVHGNIPDDADGTDIGTFDGEWFAIHYEAFGDDDAKRVGCNRLERIECRYPDFRRLLSDEPEQCAEMPMFASQLLALPHQMFGRGGPVKFKPYGKSAPCQLLVDPITDHFYGKPFLVIMPMRDNSFDLCAELLNEKSM
ncbi:hypothetical protein [Cedecea sp. P7760]|uniref:hypothetical protein n=1 Tax=Cedecea sp. P7760 TaxID=2726983 RepID=UPI00159FC7F1|nr:hypothetical protein [Cedecea sp. P7760]NWC65430.1 hypothetical protein [Cedecea sp. P7760]